MIYIFNKEKLDYEKPSKMFLFKWSVALFIMFLSLSFAMSKFVYKDIILREEAKLIVLKENNKFSKKDLKEYLLQLNIKFPNIVLAQAELESGHFKSVMFKENNNLFGMKQA